jgi:hypothetical protein
MFWQHRQVLPDDWQLSAELGYISDRNFLQSYYQQEWDTLKDESTGLELKQTRENRSLSVAADVRLSNFFTQTEWLPRGDHYWLGQPLFNDTFTWYEHTSAGFARFKPANPPSNPNDQPFEYLPWETSNVPIPYNIPHNAPVRYGQVLSTRQEIDWPFQLGPVKIVPYGLGDVANWGQDLEGDPLTRTYWQAGLRASMPIWSVDPTIESELFNVHGIAHKVTFEADFSYAQANKDLALLPLYDPLDDNSIVAERQRFIVYNPNFNTFMPAKYDERYYALRSGMGDWVTAASEEIAGDMTALRLAVDQRWQTKRGMPGSEHIIDWITLNTDVTLFPQANRDNFGSVPGLANYDFRWHVGDRLTLVSDGEYDFFSGGEQTVNIGGFLTRPPRGSVYLGFRVINGPLESRMFTMSYTYRMSEKWMATLGTSIDFGDQHNLGETVSITRVGESFLINAGFTVDPTRNDFGFAMSIEPRFVPKSRLANVGSARIPVAGVEGLE